MTALLHALTRESNWLIHAKGLCVIMSVLSCRHSWNFTDSSVTLTTPRGSAPITKIRIGLCPTPCSHLVCTSAPTSIARLNQSASPDAAKILYGGAVPLLVKECHFRGRCNGVVRGSNANHCWCQFKEPSLWSVSPLRQVRLEVMKWLLVDREDTNTPPRTMGRF